ncbi:MAG: DMT family transporter [Candidatus Puniceispirillales bacterium]|tara:strand:+ start:799 stop:1722 length:924 start_codon:yes stop_codon:yes gene_type:complete
MNNKENNYPLFGILLVIGFTILGPVMDTFAKLASNEIPIGQISFSRFLVQSLIIIPIAIYLKVLYLPSLKETFLHFIRALFILIATSLFFGAIKFMPMADAIAIFLVNPFFMTFLSYFVLNEKVGWRRILACLIGFSGSMLILKPSFALFGFVALYPLGTAITYSFYMIITKHMTKNIHPVTLQAFTGTSAVIIIFPLLLIFDDSSFKPLSLVWPTINSFILLLAVGVTATISHLFVVYGLKYSPASTIAPILYLEIVSAAILGYFVFQDIPDFFTVIGVFIIMLCGVYVFMREHNQNSYAPKILRE